MFASIPGICSLVGKREKLLSQHPKIALKPTGLRYGLGKYVSQNDQEAMQNFLIVSSLISRVAIRRRSAYEQCFYVLQLSYACTLPTVKIAVLLFYSRIFPQKGFRWVLYGIGTFLSLFLISSLLTFVLQCLPVHSFWQPSLEHHCIDQVKYYIAQGSLNFVSDLFVVLMPMPVL